MSAAERWASDLASWAIPEEIRAQAIDDPWALNVAPFARAAVESNDTPSRQRAREALPPGGSVLDVGCGAGAAGLALPEAGAVTGVDENPAMLAAFTALAEQRALDVTAVEGRWPDVAPSVETADVVVCHHVLYNVADLEPFLRALTGHALARVVVEITSEHPRAWMNPYWERFWDLQRPAGPTAGAVLEVLGEMDLKPAETIWSMPAGTSEPSDVVEMLRRHLCLPPAREAEVWEAFEQLGRPAVRGIATVWWGP